MLYKRDVSLTRIVRAINHRLPSRQSRFDLRYQVRCGDCRRRTIIIESKMGNFYNALYISWTPIFFSNERIFFVFIISTRARFVIDYTNTYTTNTRRRYYKLHTYSQSTPFERFKFTIPCAAPPLSIG